MTAFSKSSILGHWVMPTTAGLDALVFTTCVVACHIFVKDLTGSSMLCPHNRNTQPQLQYLIVVKGDLAALP